jgi:hypothetical protein
MNRIAQLLFGVQPSSGGGDSPEVTQFLARLSTPPSPTRTALYVTLIDGLVADGVWSKLDTLYLYVSEDNADTDTALTNLVQAAFKATMVGTPGFTKDGGFTTTSSDSYVDTNFNPSTAGGLWTQNSASLFAQGISNQSSNASIIGIGAYDYIYPDWGGNQGSVTINNGQDAVFPSPPSAGALYLGSRTASDNLDIYLNGVYIVSGSAVANSLSNGNVKLFKNSTDATNFYPGNIVDAGLGGALDATEQLALYNRIATFLQACVPTPNVPTIGTATGGSGSVSVAFTPGASVGDPAETYIATSDHGGFVGYATSSPVVVTCVPGTYTFTVTSTNSVNTSAASAASNAAVSS